VCCGAGTYNTYGSTSCTDCPSPGYTSSPGSTHCSCAVGYFEIEKRYFSCPSGYTLTPDLLRCYKYVDAGLTWPDANYQCSLDGYGWLATIGSEAQNTAAFNAKAVGAVAWIGFNANNKDPPRTNESFTWIHGLDTYQNWFDHEPTDDGAGETCGAMWYDTTDCKTVQGCWVDAQCNVGKPYFCESKVIEGSAFCVDETHNYVIIAKNTMGTDAEPAINLAEVDLYSQGVQLTGLVFTLSTTHGSYVASNCNDNDLNNYCHTASTHEEYPDRNAFLVIDAGTQDFDKIIVTNRQDCCGERIDPATLKIYDGSLLLQTLSFISQGSAQPSYTFENWGGGILT